MEDWSPQLKYLRVCLRDSLSGHAQEQNKLIPHITWHRTLSSIQVTCDVHVREGMATSCVWSCACRLTVEKDSWGQLRSSLWNTIWAYSCSCITDLRSLMKTTTPILRRFVHRLHTSHYKLLIWVGVLSALKLSVCVQRAGRVFPSTNRLWRK